MYQLNGLLIAGAVFGAMLVATEAGFREGNRKKAAATEPVKSQVGSVLASMLGLLALLLGFTFSQALDRFDDRSRSVVNEANALGTTYLRVQLIPAEMRAEMQAKMRSYVDARVHEAAVSIADSGRETLLAQSDELANGIWALAVKAVEKDPRPATTGLFVQALNNAIDAAGYTLAATNRYVPDIAYFVLFGTFLVTAGTLGYASGVSGHRITLPALGLVLLIALVLYIIIDLDRPRRGIIRVSQESMLILQKSMAPVAAPATAPAAKR